MVRSAYAPARHTLVAILVTIFLIVAVSGLPGVTTAQPTPTATPFVATTPQIVPIDVVKLPPVGNSNEKYILYLVRVTFGVDVNPPAMHQHEGQFVLTVNSGAVCYRQGDMDATTTVTAVIPATAGEPNSACAETADLNCEVAASGRRTCTLGEDETIYLPVGSALTQEGDATHGYGNVDDVPAIVYLAGYQLDPGGAGCSGGCY